MIRITLLFLSVIFAASSTFAQSQASFPSRDEHHSFLGGESFSVRSFRLIAPRTQGMIGLFHTTSAQTAPGGLSSFGAVLSVDYFKKTDFPKSGVNTRVMTPQLGISYTPAKMFELFLAINNIYTNDEFPLSAAIKESYNLDYGAKLSFPLSANWTGALMYWGQKESNVTTIPGSAYALDNGIYLIATLDAARRMRFHANLGFQKNNNERLKATGTDQREITVLHVYEGDLLPVSLAGEYLFKWATVSLEYSIDYVFGSSVGIFAQPQRITLGSKFFPFEDRAFAAQLGVDLGLSSTTSTTVIKEPPLAFILGISYLFGVHKHAAPAAPKEFLETKTPKKVETSASKTEKTSGSGVVSGYVTNIETGDPVVGAKVYFCNDQETPVITDTAGQYRSKSLREGSCEVRIEHPQYRSAHETVQVSDDAQQSYDFGLLIQTLEKGAMLVRVKDGESNPTPATISFPEQPEIQSIKTNEFGQAKINIRPGTYMVRAKSGKFPPKTKEVTVSSKENVFVDFELSNDEKSDSKPTTTKTDSTNSTSPIAIKLSADKRQILISQKVQFQAGKTSPMSDTVKILDSVIEFLKKNPSIKKVEIRGHTDSTGNEDDNLDLSQERADIIKAYFTKKGIDPKRLQSKGYGSSKPLASNNTDEGKEKNRRVEFIVLSKSAKKVSAH